MGADLYIQSFHTKNQLQYRPAFEQALRARDLAVDQKDDAKIDAAQKEVERLWDLVNGDDGYFRDSYNGTSVMNFLGLSWWLNVIPMLDDDGKLTPKKCVDLWNSINSAPIPKVTKEFCESNNLGLDDECTLETWQAYFEKKRNTLLSFIKSAIANNEPIDTSL
jgi:hypothetical protein